MSHKPIHILFTCEHGGHEIPSEYKSLFSKATPWLKSHQGWDKGALEVAKALATHFHTELIYSQISRLLVDLNRSVGHPHLFSAWTKELPKEEKQKIMEKYYLPYRKRVMDHIHQKIDSGFLLLHISVHSFTPIWKGKIRKTEIGLLFDPHREKEKMFCQKWRKIMSLHSSQLKIHFNRPYRGNTDGLTESLRHIFSQNNYLGIELEINQKLLQDGTKQKTIQNLIESVRKLLEESNFPIK